MRPAFLSLALFLSVSLAAPSSLATRNSCPATPCKACYALIEYCAKHYSEQVIEGGQLKAAAMNCMCGHLGVEAITSPEDKKGEGWEAVIVCALCEVLTGNTKLLVEAWAVACNTWEYTGVQAALNCWNVDVSFCDPIGGG
jgi:hypothetical protein